MRIQPRTSSGVEAVFAPDVELSTGQRPVFVVATAPGLEVIPEAGGPDERTPFRPASPVIHDDLEDQIATLPLEPFPGLFAELAEYAVEWRMSDDQATDSAAVARIDHREPACHVTHL